MAERTKIDNKGASLFLTKMTATAQESIVLMDKLIIKARVYTGTGEGEKFVKLPWVKKQIIEKVGFEPYHGTLNVRLAPEDVKIKRKLMKMPSISIIPITGFYPGKCFKATFMSNQECAIVIPQVPRYPLNLIEIVAPINLRTKFKLKDGDTVEAQIPA